MRKFGVMMLGSFALVLALMPLIVVGILLNGWVIYTLWNWFVPATFERLPRLSFGAALGLTLLAKAFTYQLTDLKQQNDDELPVQMQIAMTILLPLTFLIAGGLVRWLYF